MAVGLPFPSRHLNTYENLIAGRISNASSYKQTPSYKPQDVGELRYGLRVLEWILNQDAWKCKSSMSVLGSLL